MARHTEGREPVVCDREGAVAFVLEQVERARTVAGVGDEQVGIAIKIEVEPRRGLGVIARCAHAGCDAHIGKEPAPLVAVEQTGGCIARQPAEHVEVLIPVVVVIGDDGAPPDAALTVAGIEAAPGRDICERALTGARDVRDVVIQPVRAVRAAGDVEVHPAVAVKVDDRGSAAERAEIDLAGEDAVGEAGAAGAGLGGGRGGEHDVRGNSLDPSGHRAFSARGCRLWAKRGNPCRVFGYSRRRFGPRRVRGGRPDTDSGKHLIQTAARAARASG